MGDTGGALGPAALDAALFGDVEVVARDEVQEVLP